MTDRYFLDTNILVYAYDTKDVRRATRARQLLLDGLTANRAVLSTQVISEFYVTVTRKVASPMTPEQARDEVRRLLCLETVEITVPTLLTAMELTQRYQISLWDAQILAAAALAGCSTLYSEDLQDGQAINGVTIVNPFIDHTRKGRNIHKP